MHMMDAAFSDTLVDWIPFYSLAGASAATLLGLLFVDTSLRLPIFRNPETADVSYFATFIFANMVAPMAVPGLALIPHEGSRSLTMRLVALGVIGVIMLVNLLRLTYRLNPKDASPNPGINPWTPAGRALLLAMLAPVGFLPVSDRLVATEHGAAFMVLALTQWHLLILPTGCAWLLATHASTGG